LIQDETLGMSDPGDEVDDEPDHLAKGRMTIWEHLAEFRMRLIRCVLAIVFGMVIGFFVYPYILEFLKQPYADLTGQETFLALDPLEPFATRLKISAYVGIVIAMPVLLWQIWRFVTPGLYPHEKRYAVPFVFSAMLLFIMGAGIAYMTLNPALQFLQQMGAGQVSSFYTVDNYVTLIAYMMLAFGMGFEFPVLLVALQIAGVLTPRKLLSWWRQALVVIAIVAAVITPSGDPISMMALALPMYIFYALSIVIGVLLTRKKRKAAAVEAGT
jgi:sec-independent protein translocase protein TatC